MDELQRAVAWLEDHIKWYGHNKDIAQHCRALLDALRWVPVSERLPENDQIVLVVMGSPQNGVSTACYWSSHKIWSIKANITHWRPLPAPPQSP